jgi:hypothetical protein
MFGETPPRFGDVTLVTKNGDHWKAIWAIRSVGSSCGPATARFIYGEVPEGFAVDQPPERLVNDVDYELDVGGCGRTGAAFFKFANSHIVGNERPHDEG